MRLSAMFVVQSISGLVAAMEKYAPLPNVTLHQRQATGCEGTYGAGAQFCGGASSRFCFKPNLGQTCCPDNGYCDKGFYCAPVAKYCCAEGEDLVTCARNAGFVLPASLACSTAGYASAGLTTGVTAVTPSLPPSPTDIPPNFGVVTTADVASVQTVDEQSVTAPEPNGGDGFTAPTTIFAGTSNFDVPSATTISNATTTPYIQVSAAGRHAMARFGTSALVWISVALGVRVVA
ncbi:hypothetical protein PG985_015167 [Apiospora marii]|uniref:uncharacterized protein n=1 Tax=Apiospora marii TaxID=335849 RepID=UPI00312DDAAB